MIQDDKEHDMSRTRIFEMMDAKRIRMKIAVGDPQRVTTICKNLMMF